MTIIGTFTRLARGGEVLAMRAAGVSFLQLTLPLVGLALVGSALSFVVAAWASPWANRGLERAITDMARTRISAALSAGVFSPWVEDLVVYVGTGPVRLVVESILGPLFGGVSIDLDGGWRYYISIGRLFR